jgi:mercuric ion transport protein
MTNSRIEPQERGEPLKDTGATILTVGGLAAALGVASCCGLPLLLGALGIGSAWLTGLAALAAPHRVLLLTAAAVCLAAGAVLSWRGGPDAACSSGTVCSHPIVRRLTVFGLLIGSILLTIGYLYV